MKRMMIFLYGAVSYVLFLAVFLYAIGFVGNFGVPKTLDSAVEGDWWQALFVDLGLLSVFAVHTNITSERSMSISR